MRTLIVLAIVLGAATAVAQDADPKAKAAAEYAEGQKLYAAGSFDAAAGKFKAAYALDPDPAYLFNIAQALRFGKKQCAEAAGYYKQFLAQVTSAPNLDKVHEYLDEVEACAKKQTTQPPPPPPPPVEPKPSSGGGGGTLGLAVTGLGVAFLGTAGFFHWDANYLANQRNRFYASCTPRCPSGTLNDYDSRGHVRFGLAIAFDVAGTAAIIGGIYLYVRSRHTTEQPPVAIAPTAGGAMVSTGWSF
jgi:tetratricopeptide (TPR) repeat protein